jgi:hypothetical protein
VNDEPRGDELHADPREDDGGMDAVSPHYREQAVADRLDEILTGREVLLADLQEFVRVYSRMASAGLGVSSLGLKIHKLLDRITSDVYGQTFEYCGRKHTVI